MEGANHERNDPGNEAFHIDEQAEAGHGNNNLQEEALDFEQFEQVAHIFGDDSDSLSQWLLGDLPATNPVEETAMAQLPNAGTSEDGNQVINEWVSYDEIDNFLSNQRMSVRVPPPSGPEARNTTRTEGPDPSGDSALPLTLSFTGTERNPEHTLSAAAGSCSLEPAPQNDATAHPTPPLRSEEIIANSHHSAPSLLVTGAEISGEAAQEALQTKKGVAEGTEELAAFFETGDAPDIFTQPTSIVAEQMPRIEREIVLENEAAGSQKLSGKEAGFVEAERQTSPLVLNKQVNYVGSSREPNPKEVPASDNLVDLVNKALFEAETACIQEGAPLEERNSEIPSANKSVPVAELLEALEGNGENRQAAEGDQIQPRLHTPHGDKTDLLAKRQGSQASRTKGRRSRGTSRGFVDLAALEADLTTLLPLSTLEQELDLSGTRDSLADNGMLILANGDEDVSSDTFKDILKNWAQGNGSRFPIPKDLLFNHMLLLFKKRFLRKEESSHAVLLSEIFNKTSSNADLVGRCREFVEVFECCTPGDLAFLVRSAVMQIDKDRGDESLSDVIKLTSSEALASSENCEEGSTSIALLAYEAMERAERLMSEIASLKQPIRKLSGRVREMKQKTGDSNFKEGRGGIVNRLFGHNKKQEALRELKNEMLLKLYRITSELFVHTESGMHYAYARKMVDCIQAFCETDAGLEEKKSMLVALQKIRVTGEVAERAYQELVAEVHGMIETSRKKLGASEMMKEVMENLTGALREFRSKRTVAHFMKEFLQRNETARQSGVARWVRMQDFSRVEGQLSRLKGGDGNQTEDSGTEDDWTDAVEAEEVQKSLAYGLGHLQKHVRKLTREVESKKKWMREQEVLVEQWTEILRVQEAEEDA